VLDDRAIPSLRLTVAPSDGCLNQGKRVLPLLTGSEYADKHFPEGQGMCCRFSLSAVCLVALAFLAAAPQTASAQPGLDVFVTPFPNAPFSGVIQVQRTFVDKDGTVSSYKTMREIGRDTQGRIFNEVRTLEPLSFTGTPDVRGILIDDPQTRTSTHLDPKARTFTTGTVNRPPETVPPRAALCFAHRHQSPAESVPQGRRSRRA
jgi:hypothetical protein